MRRASAIVALVWSAIAPTAFAQDALGQARAALDRADFDEAVTLFDQAAEGSNLDRAGVITLLEGRAIAKHAGRDVAGAEQDLLALLSLEPEAELGEMAPPALQREFARLRGEVRGRVAIESDASRVPDAFVVRTRVQDDVTSLVRDVRVSWDDEGSWRTESGREVRILAGSSLRYYVEAIGPGGAVIASQGSRDDPRVAGGVAGAPVEGSAEAIEPPRPASDDSGLWIGLGIGIAVVVAVAIVLAIVFTLPVNTQPSAPMEMF